MSYDLMIPGNWIINGIEYAPVGKTEQASHIEGDLLSHALKRESLCIAHLEHRRDAYVVIRRMEYLNLLRDIEFDLGVTKHGKSNPV